MENTIKQNMILYPDGTAILFESDTCIPKGKHRFKINLLLTEVFKLNCTRSNDYYYYTCNTSKRTVGKVANSIV